MRHSKLYRALEHFRRFTGLSPGELFEFKPSHETLHHLFYEEGGIHFRYPPFNHHIRDSAWDELPLNEHIVEDIVENYEINSWKSGPSLGMARYVRNCMREKTVSKYFDWENAEILISEQRLTVEPETCYYCGKVVD